MGYGALVLTVVLHAALAPLWLACVCWRAERSKAALAGHVCWALSWAGLMGAAGGGWHVIGAPARWAMLGLSLALAAAAVVRHRDRAWRPQRWTGWLTTAVWGALGLLIASAAVSVAQARGVEAPSVALEWPLPDVTAYVVQGGAHEALNHHYGVPAQRHALDIVALSAWGRRADGLMPESLGQYAVFGARVVAPCAGRVALARGDLADQRPPQPDRAHIMGNHVVLHCAQHTVVLAHLKQGSVRVRRGDRVEPGVTLGQVGNTGNTSEPHLHIHALEGAQDDVEVLVGSGAGALMRFAGATYARGDVIAPR